MRKTFYLILWLIIFIILSLVFVFYTNTGLRLALFIAKPFLPGQLKYDSLKGTLASNIQFTHFSYKNKITIKANNLNLLINPWDLLNQKVNGEISWSDLQVKQFSSVEGSSELAGTFSHLQLNQLSISTLQGKIEGNIKLTTTPQLSWEANITATHLNPGVLQQDLPGKINFQLSSTGEIGKTSLYYQIDLKQLSGYFRRHQLSGYLKFIHNNSVEKSINSDIRLDNAHLMINGDYKFYWQIKWFLHIPNLAMILPNSQGEIDSQGAISGQLLNPILQGNIKAENVIYQQFHLGSLLGKIYVDFLGKQNSKLNLTAQNIYLDNTNIATLNLNAEGTLSNQKANLKVIDNSQQLDLSLNGQFNQQQWQGQITQLTYNNNGQTFKLTKPSPVTYLQQQLIVNPICLTNQLTTACLQGSWLGGKAWTMKLIAEKIPLDYLQNFIPQHFLISNSANANVEIASSKTGKLSANAKIILSKGTIQYPAFDNQQTIPISQGDITTTLNDKGFNTYANMKFESGETLQGYLTLPNYTGEGLPKSSQAIEGKFDLSVDHLKLLPLFMPQLESPTGQVKVNLSLLGTIAKPQLSGLVKLSNASAEIPQLEIKPKDISATIHILNTGALTINATLHSGQGLLNIQGNGLWQNNNLSTDIQITGNNFLLSKNDDAEITASPDLHFKNNGNVFHLTGSITIPEANIHPIDFGSDVVEADDIVLIRNGRPITKSSNFDLFSNIKVILGDKIFLKYKGIDAHLKGELIINDSPNSLTTAVGTLYTESGKYTAYGQDLKFSHGRLIFTGGPINNPGLDLQATKTIHTTVQNGSFNIGTSIGSSSVFMAQTPTLVLGINVQHTLRKPVITFFSQPAGLSQADILSYLLIGRPANQATKAGKQTLVSAVSALNLSGASVGNLTNQIKDSLGLSELGLESDSEFNKDNDLVSNTSVVLGKYLTPRLYISYSIGILQPINTFRARYQLSRRWVVQAETNTNGNGADLFYSIERK